MNISEIKQLQEGIDAYKALFAVWNILAQEQEISIMEHFFEKGSIVIMPPFDAMFKVEDYMLIKGVHLYLISLLDNPALRLITDETVLKKK